MPNQKSKTVRKRSSKTKFTSEYTDLGPVSHPQILAELMIKRQAAKANKSLPDKFWNLEEWHKKFMLQIFRANQLLKKYPFDVILKVMQNLHWVYSLLPKFLVKHFDTEYAALKKSMNTKLETVEGDVVPRKQIKTENNVIDKLRAIDGPEEG